MKEAFKENKLKTKQFFKENFKVILAIIITTILVGGTATFATYNYFAKDIEYEKKDGTKISVENALNELYKEKIYLYNSNINKFSQLEDGYDGWHGQFSEELYDGKKCIKYVLEEYNDGWSCNSSYIANIENISNFNSLTINFSKIYSSGIKLCHNVRFMQDSKILDAVPIYDQAVDLNNKSITIDLINISKNVNKICIGIISGIGKDNIYNCLVNGLNYYTNSCNGKAYAYINEVYLEK